MCNRGEPGDCRHCTQPERLEIPCEINEAFNPCTTPACKILGLKNDGRTCKQYIFQSRNTSTFNAMHFDENPFTCQCYKEGTHTKTEGFQIRPFIGLLQVISRQ